MKTPTAKSDNARTKRNTPDGVCMDGVSFMAHITKKLAVVAIKLDKMFATLAAVVGPRLTFSPGTLPGNVIGQLIEGVVSLPEEFITKGPVEEVRPTEENEYNQKLSCTRMCGMQGQ